MVWAARTRLLLSVVFRGNKTSGISLETLSDLYFSHLDEKLNKVSFLLKQTLQPEELSYDTAFGLAASFIATRLRAQTGNLQLLKIPGLQLFLLGALILQTMISL